MLRYGENPHQRGGALHRTARRPGWRGAEQLHGKEMSYNNYVDADAAWRAAHDHGDVPTVAIIKHANPCGIAIGADVAEAHRKAHATATRCRAFGGVIATNREVSVDDGRAGRRGLHRGGRGAGVRTPRRCRVLTRKKNVRLLRLPDGGARGGAEMRPIAGGLLLQQRDLIDAPGDDPATWTLATGDRRSRTTCWPTSCSPGGPAAR